MEKRGTNDIVEYVKGDEEFQSIIESTKYIDVFFTILQDFMPKISEDYHVQKDVACKLFVYYLQKLKEEKNIPNLYEKVLLKFAGYFSLSEETMAFLLFQDIDINYEGVDMYGTPGCLRDTLALGLTNYPHLLGMYLDKIGGSKYKTFGNGHYELYTDTVRMNLAAGRIDEAIALFESEEYMLFPMDEEEVRSKLSVDGEGLFVDEFLGGSADNLFSLLMSVRSDMVPLNLRRAFLNTILYSPKIKLFNKDCLRSIACVLTEDELARFEEYLIKKSFGKEIIMYSMRNTANMIFYEREDQVFSPDTSKKLQYVKEQEE